MLFKTLEMIQPLNEEIMKQTRQRVDQLVKPQGSLGMLEEIAIQLSGITETAFPSISDKAIVVMCADHGVCEEGVASAPPIVTWIQSQNIAKGITGVGALAKLANIKLYPVDIAINTTEESNDIYNRKIAFGSDNISKGHAMTKEKAIQAIEVGIEMANYAIEKGANCLGTGEMGIGNTTPTTAMLCALTGASPEEVTGIGANLPLDQVPHKASVIKRALTVNAPNSSDILDVLAKVGGYDIAGMAGVMIGAAARRTPVIIDGYISTLSAIVACKLEPKVKNYLFASHASEEKGASLASEHLGLKPFLKLNMRLGEGSGAALAFQILEAACAMNSEMITFSEAGIGVV